MCFLGLLHVYLIVDILQCTLYVSILECTHGLFILLVLGSFKLLIVCCYIVQSLSGGNFELRALLCLEIPVYVFVE